MSRIARVSKAPVTIRHGGETFQFDESGTRQVSAKEEAILQSYTSDRFKLTFEDEPKKSSKSEGSSDVSK